MIAGQGRSDSRCSTTFRTPTSCSCRSAAEVSSPDRDGGQGRSPTRASRIEPELRTRRREHVRGEPSRSSRSRSRTAQRPLRRPQLRPRVPRPQRRVRADHRGGLRGRVPLHLRPDEARMRDRRRGDGRGAPCGSRRRSTGRAVAAVVSGGNVAPETAAAILANDEGRHPSRVRPRSRPLFLRQRVPRPVRRSPSSMSRSARTATRSTRGSRSWSTRAGASSASSAGSSARARLAPRLEASSLTTVGGQAVLEGVMMRGPSNWAVAVRKPDGDIAHVNKPRSRRRWRGTRCSPGCRSSAASWRSESRSQSAFARSRSAPTTPPRRSVKTASTRRRWRPS